MSWIPPASLNASQRLRHGVQLAFLALCAWIGVDFARFVHWGMSAGRASYVAHPAGAEGFLPIAALLSLKHALLTGQIHGAHPAGLAIFVAILGIALVFKKAFCSWLCPVGSLSEGLGQLGRRWLGRNLQPPVWADTFLRGVKYLILGLFLWVVWRMDGAMLAAFLDSPFHAAADVRMYYFFVQMSGLTLAVLLILAALSVLGANAWCRYLCPYGALLGLLSLASPLRISRAKTTCIDCQRCTQACPARIQVHQASRVASDECTACYRCVAACPVPATLELRPPRGPALPAWLFGLLVLGLFLAVIGVAKVTGHWQTEISPQEYLDLIPEQGPVGR